MSKSDLKFKVGDRIEICGHWDDTELNKPKYQGLKGTVVSIDSTPPKYGVKELLWQIKLHTLDCHTPDLHGYWMHARNMKASTSKEPTKADVKKPILKVKVDEKAFLKVGTRVVMLGHFGSLLGNATIVEVHPTKGQPYLIQFDKKHSGLHDGNGASDKKHTDQTCYWVDSGEINVVINEAKPIEIPTKIGEFNVVPKAYPFEGKFYLEIDRTKPMVFTKTHNAFDAQGRSIDIIAVLPTPHHQFISAMGALNENAYIICPREYTPVKKVTHTEIEEKFGFKIEVV